MDYICNSCGKRYVKWQGRCTACNEWDTVVEDKEIPSDERGRWISSGTGPVDLASIKKEQAAERWLTGVSEMDQVLGGGFLPASIGLLGGEPGIGKSTLILQLLGRLLTTGKKCLYISGEESVSQIKSRADRLNSSQEGLLVAVECEIEKILAIIEQVKPNFVVIDSIQTLFTSRINSTAGSIVQLRESTAILTQYAKSQNCTFLLVGHVTKDGTIAGPKTIEHMVDYVLYLEGTTNEDYRFLRAIKNRFGNVNELGFFKMTALGLSEVKSPNKIFLESWQAEKSGSVIFPANEGSRIMFAEVQALVSSHSSSFPSRTALGIERNRLLILVAILEKQLKINLSPQDIYLNISGGIRISDVAIDMAIVGAIYSSYKNLTISKPLTMIGEAVLSGVFNEAKNTKDKISMLEQSAIDFCIYASSKKLTKKEGYYNVNSFPELIATMNKLYKS